ncbi:MAG: hypothetical protein V1797_17545 [Pseudomonadota bacterium]
MKNALVLLVIVVGLIGGYAVYNHTENENAKLRFQLEHERKEAALEIERKKEALERERKKAALEAERRREEEEKKKNASLANRYAKVAGENLLHKIHPFLGGQNLLVNVDKWKYDKYSDEFSINIEMFWDGSIISSNRYNINGVLTCNHAGDKSSFTRTYANSQMRDYEDSRNWLLAVFAGAVILGSLDQ